MLSTEKIDDLTQCSQFSTPGGVDEIFIAVKSPLNAPFDRALAETTERYLAALDHLHLGTDSIVFSRIFLSDGANQNKIFADSSLAAPLKQGALSVIEQKPLNGGPLSLFSYHLRSGRAPLQKKVNHEPADPGSNSACIAGENYSLLATANFPGERGSDAYTQSVRIFNRFADRISGEGMTLPDNVLRTWIFLRDVDCHYGDMVRARRKFFDRQGLTDKTRFLASTGIEGRMADWGNLISMDAVSMGGLTGAQVIRVEAPDHLSPTLLYGVTFERGLAVRFGDRLHVYISGTASINNKGEVLFPGDAGNQTRRTLENINALLATRGGDLADMAYFIAYARNFHDRDAVERVIRETIDPRVPLIFVEAPVCRPAWLVELEGMAILPHRSDFPPFL
jgi:enamine deaminase RidA (YjgF/YER057c/UK114 family)